MDIAPPNPYKSDAVLRRIQESGTMVLLVSQRGETYTGLIKGFDRYSITILRDGVEATFFKHALLSYEPVSSDHQR